MSAALAETQTPIVLPIRGMTCLSCAARLERVLAKQPGVLAANVNFATEEASVVPNGGEGATQAALRRAVQAAGFDVPRAEPAAVATVQPEGDGGSSLRAALALPVALLVMASSMGWIPGLPMHSPAAQGIAAGLSAVSIFVLMSPYWRGALTALRHGSATMDTLVVLGGSVAWSWSMFRLVSAGAHVDLWFDAAAALPFFLLLGRALETRAKGRARDAMRGLLDLRVATASVERGDGRWEDVPTERIEIGDRVAISPHTRVPADGVVVSGHSAIDESALTGESVPREKLVGDSVIAGTWNGEGALVVSASAAPGEGSLDTAIRLLREAQGKPAAVQRLADRVSAVFVPAVMVLALLVGVAHAMLGNGLDVAMLRAATVLIVACPCALGLATPIAVLIGTGVGARQGVLIRAGTALEVAGRITDIVFDKTGTLTVGAPVVTHTELDGVTIGEVAIALAPSQHPLARAVAAASPPIGRPDGFRALPGLGVEATVAGRAMLAGSERLLAERGIETGKFEAAAISAAKDGASLIWVAVAGAVAGFVAVADRLRDDAGEAVRGLRALGIEPRLASGDHRAAVDAIARSVGIEQGRAEAGLLPAAKVETVRRLQAEGRVVAMVGDGANDAPALASADLGIAMGTGADIAAEAAQIVLLRGGLHGVERAIRLSRATLSVIRQNLAWAFGYNLVMLPVAAGALLPFGIDLGPAWASAAMALSSLSVVANALRLRRFRA